MHGWRGLALLMRQEIGACARDSDPPSPWAKERTACALPLRRPGARAKNVPGGRLFSPAPGRPFLRSDRTACDSRRSCRRSRPCSRASFPPPSLGSRRSWSGSRSTSGEGRPPSGWWGFPPRRSARPRDASTPPWPWPRRARGCPASRASGSWANSPWTAGPGRCGGPWPRPPVPTRRSPRSKGTSIVSSRSTISTAATRATASRDGRRFSHSARRLCILWLGGQSTDGIASEDTNQGSSDRPIRHPKGVGNLISAPLSDGSPPDRSLDLPALQDAKPLTGAAELDRKSMLTYYQSAETASGARTSRANDCPLSWRIDDGIGRSRQGGVV